MDDREDNYETHVTRPSEIWKLAESVSIVQAALLMLDIEPQGVSAYVEGNDADFQPTGYLAARNAIASAVRNYTANWNREEQQLGGLKGDLHWEEDELDVAKSTVNMDSLRAWLWEKGFDTVFFSSEAKEPSFKSKTHSRYSPKLAAAVEAWEAYEDNQDSVGTPKQKLEKWLRLNAARFGFTDDDGNPQEQVIKDLAKVANWATRGGAPKQVDDESVPF